MCTSVIFSYFKELFYAYFLYPLQENRMHSFACSESNINLYDEIKQKGSARTNYPFTCEGGGGGEEERMRKRGSFLPL